MKAENFGIGHWIKAGLAFLLLGYPLFYFSYKFCLPDFGGQDFYSYYYLYQDWDFEKTPSPFNMRLVSSYAIHLLYKAGFHYDTEIVLSKIYSGPDPAVFFSAILFNFLCVVATCLVIYRTVMRFLGNSIYAFCGGLIYLLGFGTIFFSLKPLSEACGILLLALAYYQYLRKSNWIYLVLLISVFQREYIFFIFIVLAVLDYWFRRDKYYLGILAGSVLAFASYYVLRKTLFFTPHFDYQTSFSTFLSSLLHPNIDAIPFFMQSFMASNILLLYLGLLAYKKWKRQPIDRVTFLQSALLFAQVIAMSIAAQFGNNAGRYFYYASPILIFFLLKELKPLVSTHLRFHESVPG